MARVTRKDKILTILLDAKEPLTAGQVTSILEARFGDKVSSSEISKAARDHKGLFNIAGDPKHYTYTLTSEGEAQARSSKAMASMVEREPSKRTVATRREIGGPIEHVQVIRPPKTQKDSFFLKVLPVLEAAGRPMGVAEIARAFDQRYGLVTRRDGRKTKADTTYVAAGMLVGLRTWKHYVKRTGETGSYLYSITDNGIAALHGGQMPTTVAEPEPTVRRGRPLGTPNKPVDPNKPDGRRSRGQRWTVTMTNGTKQIAAEIGGDTMKQILLLLL